MRTLTTTAAWGAATVAAAAALIAVDRRGRAASTLAATPGARTTGRARRRAPAHVRAGARPEHPRRQPEHRDDQPDPDNYTRAAITI